MSKRPKRRGAKKLAHPGGDRVGVQVVIRPAVQPVPGDLAVRLFYTLCALAFLSGTILRLAFITTQILLDDEWHAMDYAVGNSAGFLLTHFSVPGATSIPMNVYTRLLLQMGGWNETLLRLPALVPGIAALVVLPWLARKAFSRTVTVVFAWLLAISPCLVFYSRIARPYAMVALAAGAAVLCGYLWLVSGRRSLAVLYVTAGVAAVYFHLFALVSVAGPIACGICFRLFGARSWLAKEKVVPSFGQLAAVVGAFAVTLGLLLVPALLNAAGGPSSSVVRTGSMSAETAVHFASMLAGTSGAVLTILFWVFLAVGTAILSRRTPLLATILIGGSVLYLPALIVAEPQMVSASLVVSRYVIGLFPVALILVAQGLVGAANMVARPIGPDKWRRGAGVATATAFIAALFALGPIPRTYDRPNDFTAHSAFLESYAPIDWSRSYRSEMAEEVPVIDGFRSLSSFYRRLAADTRSTTIIEFPMYVGNVFNLYYYYQHFHKKRVLAGFFPHFALQNVQSTGWVWASYYVDYVMSRQHDPDSVKMSNMVDLTSPDAVRRSGADYVILHRHLMTEMSPRTPREPEPDYPPVEPLTQLYGREFGQPVFQDANLIVFRTGTPAP